MRIFSNGDRLIVHTDDRRSIEWIRGSHYAHIVRVERREVDVFSFAWQKNRTSMLDFTTALQSYLSEE